MLPKSWKTASIFKLLQETTTDLTSLSPGGTGTAFNINFNNEIKVDYKTLPFVTPSPRTPVKHH